MTDTALNQMATDRSWPKLFSLFAIIPRRIVTGLNFQNNWVSFFNIAHKRRSHRMRKTSEVSDHIFSAIGILWSISSWILTFPLPRTPSNSFVRRIGIINTIINDIVSLYIFNFLWTPGSLNVKLVVIDIKVIPCRMNVWVSLLSIVPIWIFSLLLPKKFLVSSSVNCVPKSGLAFRIFILMQWYYILYLWS